MSYLNWGGPVTTVGCFGELLSALMDIENVASTLSPPQMSSGLVNRVRWTAYSALWAVI